MKILASSYPVSKIILENRRIHKRIPHSRCNSSFNRTYLLKFFSPKLQARGGSLDLVSSRHIHSSSTHSTDSQVRSSAKEAEIQNLYKSELVHVKFRLQKECMFGDHFYIVGNDPIVGLWDPVNAIPLNWSDGHVWTIELDIPVEKTIEFKFVLKGSDGKIIWQPGMNRVLETPENYNALIVYEDWERAEHQKIVEEELVPAVEKMEPDASSVVSMVDVNTAIDERAPVLVPGLIPLLTRETEEVIGDEEESSSSSSSTSSSDTNGIGAVKIHTLEEQLDNKYYEEPKLLNGQGVLSMKQSKCLNEKEEPSVSRENLFNGFEQTYRPSAREAVSAVWQNDIQWGRKKLQKLLISLGFL